MAKKKRKIILLHTRAPGDIVTMTGLVRDIALAHGDRIELGVKTSAMDLWRHNPYLTLEAPKGAKKRRPSDVEFIKAQYGKGIKEQNYRPIHFLAYWHENFKLQTGLSVPLSKPYPDLHLSPEEQEVPLLRGRYWLTLSGGKSDYPIKVWRVRHLQKVVDGLGDLGLGVVQAGSNDSGHWHPPLTGEHVLDLRGQTNLRDLMRLIQHAEGVICGVTASMHIAAALQKPCVVIGGGREAWWWEAYVRENKGLAPVQDQFQTPHRYLHTIGLLDCCRQHGCWRNKVVATGKDKSLCLRPLLYEDQPTPACMDMIRPHHVLEAVMAYYEDGSLPPIQPEEDREVGPRLPQSTPPQEKPAALLRLFDVAEKNGKRTEKEREKNEKRTEKEPSEAEVARTPDGFRRLQPKMATDVKMEGRGEKSSRPIPTRPGMPNPGVINTDGSVFDHEDIGGKFTAFILFYGGEEFFDLHQRCLGSVLSTIPAERVDLRVGSNALNRRSLAMIENYCQQGRISKHYRRVKNDYKYPVMREMFFDETHPIKTKWVLWFDDDSIADRTPAWLNVLSQHIIQYHRRNQAHMFGAPFIWTLQPGQREWYESRPWFHGKPWRTHKGQPSPNGNKIHFATGGFWALTHEAIIKADIPDPEIGHNGGDITIGEQLYQAGFKLKAWNAKKQFIHTSSVKRRGESLPMPGRPGHAPKLVQLQ